MIKKYVHTLKQKPEHHRHVAAFVASGVVTGLILLIWTLTLPIRFASLKAAPVDQTAAVVTAGGSVSPFEAIEKHLNSLAPDPSTFEAPPSEFNAGSDIALPSDTAPASSGKVQITDSIN